MGVGGSAGEEMLRMDQVHVIRHKVLVEGRSARLVAREMGLSRNTVRRYLAQGTVIGARRAPVRPAPVREVVAPRLEALLASMARSTAGKQRLTATRLHRMLVAEGVRVGVTVVKELVAERKRQAREVFVPLVYRPGDLGEVDFFEVLVDVAGERSKAWMFLLRVMHSGRDFAWLYPRQDQVCFLDGHVRAFAHLGGVPQRLLYDNLKPAVARVLVGSERELTARFTALATHYVFEPCFARPATGHDKGGVEARGRAIRLQHLTPIPTGATLGEINGMLVKRLDDQLSERRDGTDQTIGALWTEERRRLLPLPPLPFDAAATRLVSVSRRSLARVDGAVYSAPSPWAGLDATAYVGVDEVVLVGPRGERVRHARRRFGGRAIDYRHYLKELARKPAAVRQVADELIPALGAPYAAVWQELVDVHGPKQAARVFAHILAAVVDHGHERVATRLSSALKDGTPVLLAIKPAVESPPAMSTEAIPASLQSIEIVGSTAAAYDALLAGAL
jgi:transposase